MQTETYGTILANGHTAVEDGFSFQVSDQVPDNHEVFFTLTAVAGDTWLSEFQVTAWAPVVAAGNALIDDGEGNGIPDPGESFDISIQLINAGHSNSLPVTAALTCSSEFINGTQWALAPVSIDALTEVSAVFENVEAYAQTPIGTSVAFLLTLTEGNPATIILEKEYIFVIGQVSEDFETGDFSQHPWGHGGDANWIITGTTPFEGNYSAQSGNISDNETSDLFVPYEVLTADSIRFFYRVSSESGYDFLRFYIDNVKAAEWSGEADWSYTAFAITAGIHTFWMEI